MNTSVLIMTCDAYDDLWKPFFHLYKKYWGNNPYKTYICTETKDCKYAETIKTQGSWTSRFRQALEQIKTDYVITLLDDFFFHKEVNQERLEYVISQFKEDTAVFNLQVDYEHKTEKSDVEGFRVRPNKQIYMCSCQPSIWNRKILIELLQKDMTPWEWETQRLDSKYDFYINTQELVFDIGYYKERKPWCIVQGKWATESIELFKRENIEMDFSKRGIYDLDLSIIIPFYINKSKGEEFYSRKLQLTKDLLDVLIPQLTPKVEVIIIDDGCYEKELDKYPIKVIHQDNGGVSKARNKGLDIKTGKFVRFIDSDDLVTNDYIEKNLKKISEEDFDYCLNSWRYLGGRDVIIKDMPPAGNTSVWNCIYKSETIGNIRFNENKQIAEDTEFNLKVRKGKKANLEYVLYIYRSSVEDSLSNNYRNGVIGMERPIETQVIIYRSKVTKVGGIETAVYNACNELKDIYDVIFLYDEADEYQLKRLQKLVKCIKYQGQTFKCNLFTYYGSSPRDVEKTLIADRIHHQCCNNSEVKLYKASPKANIITADSETSAKAYTKVTGDKCGVLYNLFAKPEYKKCFSLMSATRLGTDKGSIGDRIYKFARRLNERGILFTWDVFTGDKLESSIDGLIKREPKLNVVDYMWNKDFIVQLSDNESWGCTPTESLERGVPVIATRYQSVHEQIEHGKNGYILELDMSNMDEVIDRMLSEDLKGFKYKKKDSIKQWINFIGDLGGKKDNYVYVEEKEEKATVKAIEVYQDNELGKIVAKGDTWETSLKRALYLQDERRLVEII